MEDKTDRLNALIDKSWMYRALKMETEIEELRTELSAFRHYHRHSMECLFDRLHDISVQVGINDRNAVEAKTPAPVNPAPPKHNPLWATSFMSRDEMSKIFKNIGNT